MINIASDRERVPYNFIMSFLIENALSARDTVTQLINCSSPVNVLWNEMFRNLKISEDLTKITQSRCHDLYFPPR